MLSEPQLRPVVGFCLLAGLLAACDAGEPACRVNADCASGVCGADGRCVAVGQDAGDEGDAGADAVTPSDGGADTGGDATPQPDGSPVLCVPDHDGVVTRAETPLAAGLHATYRVALDAAVDTAGTPQAGGQRHWDLSGALAGDHGLYAETLPVAGQWFAADFPGATYASRLSDTEDLLGVFEVTDEALLLRGVVSPADGLTRTELTYDPPVTTLAFPLEVGATFSTDATVSGLALGVYSLYSEKYESQVDAAGEIVTPYGTFPVLRVRTVLTRTVALVPTVVRTFAFVAECFSTVATIRSRDNETSAEFTQAAEVWRLSP